MRRFSGLRTKMQIFMPASNDTSEAVVAAYTKLDQLKVNLKKAGYDLIASSSIFSTRSIPHPPEGEDNDALLVEGEIGP